MQCEQAGRGRQSEGDARLLPPLPQALHGTRDNWDATAHGYTHDLESIIYNNLWALFYKKFQNTKCLMLTDTIIYEVKKGLSNTWKKD